MERIYYFHSKCEADPKGHGKRMTICCIVDNEMMVYGISRGHDMDQKRWNRKLGRRIAEAHARKSPILEVSKPERGVKVQFINDCKNIIVNHLRVVLGGEEAFKAAVDKLLLKKKELIERETKKLEELDKFFQNLFKPIELKVVA